MNFPPDLPESFAARADAVGLRPEDVTENFILGSGHGGQNRNKRSTAVQLVHHPSGIEIRSFHKRMQHQNRMDAWERLLMHLEAQRSEAAQNAVKATRTLRVQKQKRPRAVKETILRAKKKRSEVKQLRKPLP